MQHCSRRDQALLWRTQSLQRATPGASTQRVGGRGRETTNRERPRSISGCGPPPPSVQSKPFIGNNLEQPTAAEGIGVRLAFDLENVEREENNFTDPDYTGRDRKNSSNVSTPTVNEGSKPSSSRVHNCLPGALSERIIELVAVVHAKIVADKRLATIFVDSLQDLYCPERAPLTTSLSVPVWGYPYLYLVARGITKTWEQREELTSRCCAGVFLEDNNFQLGGRGDLALVAHQALRNCVDLTCRQLVAQPDTKIERNGGVISYRMENR